MFFLIFSNPKNLQILSSVFPETQSRFLATTPFCLGEDCLFRSGIFVAEFVFQRKVAQFSHRTKGAGGQQGLSTCLQFRALPVSCLGHPRASGDKIEFHCLLSRWEKRATRKTNFSSCFGVRKRRNYFLRRGDNVPKSVKVMIEKTTDSVFGPNEVVEEKVFSWRKSIRLALNLD